MFFVDISLEPGNSYYSLTGIVSKVTTNRRLSASLNRLNYSIIDDNVIIPFNDKEEIVLLQELQHLLEKFDLDYSLSEKINNELSSFSREQQQFSHFTKQANLIRNNKFHEFPELIHNFDEFRKVIATKFCSERLLYPLQILSAFHLAFSQNSCNFAVPGAGKTSIVYAAFAYLSSLPENSPKYVNKLMVIGPLSSFAPWEKEYKECFGHKGTFKRLSGDVSIKRNEKLQHLYAASPSDVTLVFHGGVDSLQTDIINFLKQNKTMLVVDEAHRIKNPDGIWGQSIVEISKEARARVILTGTPLPNGFQDIYNLYKFIYPFKYKDIVQFHYQNLIDMTKSGELDSARVNQLKSNLSPYFIRIKKSDLDLPPFEEVIHKVEMNEKQREIYDFIESNYIKSFKVKSSADVQDFVNKAKLIRLRQAASNPALLAKPLINAMENNAYNGEVDPNSKYISLNELFVDDSDFFNRIINYDILETPQKYIQALNLIKTKILPKSEKIIIWTIFIENAKGLQTYLNKNNINTRLLIGEVEQIDREQTIDQFNDSQNLDFQVVVANPFAVAESISLHKGCHNALYLERDYNCSNFIQSKDRIHRVGLNKNQLTTYHYFVCRDSIDEVIHTKLLSKLERMEKIINDDIPLFSRINENDETDIINELIANYARRT